MSHTMTESERRQFLAEGTRTAKVSTTRADGRPHVAICVDDERAPYAYVVIEGAASLSEEPTALLRWATIIAGRYMGADQAEAFGQRNGVPGELLVPVTPTNINAVSGVAD